VKERKEGRGTEMLIVWTNKLDEKGRSREEFDTRKLIPA
jgi:hypothetical protein